LHTDGFHIQPGFLVEPIPLLNPESILFRGLEVSKMDQMINRFHPIMNLEPIVGPRKRMLSIIPLDSAGSFNALIGPSGSSYIIDVVGYICGS